MRLLWACLRQFGPGLYDITTLPDSLKVRILKAEVILDTAVRACDVDPQRKTLRQTPNGASSPPAKSLASSADNVPTALPSRTPRDTFIARMSYYLG